MGGEQGQRETIMGKVLEERVCLARLAGIRPCAFTKSIQKEWGQRPLPMHLVGCGNGCGVLMAGL